jgi:hypothetical protein
MDSDKKSQTSLFSECLDVANEKEEKDKIKIKLDFD